WYRFTCSYREIGSFKISSYLSLCSAETNVMVLPSPSASSDPQAVAAVSANAAIAPSAAILLPARDALRENLILTRPFLLFLGPSAYHECVNLCSVTYDRA